MILTIYPFLATLSLFQLTYQQIVFNNSKYMAIITTNDKNLEQSSNTILLASSLLTIGCYFGTYLVIQLLKLATPRVIFVIADFIYIFSTFFTFILNGIKATDESRLSLYFITRILTGTSCGINMALAPVYIKSMTNKSSQQLYSKLIPLSLQFGYLFGLLMTEGKQDQYEYYLMLQLIPIIFSMVRILLFSVVFTENTPEYYFFVKKNEKKGENLYKRIHNDKVPIANTMNTLLNNFEGDHLYKNNYISKYFQCVLLVFITEITGIYIITTDFDIVGQQDYNSIKYGLIVSIITIVANAAVAKYIQKKILIILGQCILLAGLGVLSFFKIQDNQLIQIVGSCVYYFGYSLGIGTLIYSIIPNQIPDIGVIHCVIFQWFFQLFSQCLVALINNKAFFMRKIDEQYKVLRTTLLCFFTCSCIGLIILVYLFKSRPAVQNNLSTTNRDSQSESPIKGIISSKERFKNESSKGVSFQQVPIQSP